VCVALLDVAAWHASTNLSSADAKVLAKRKRLQLTPDCDCDEQLQQSMQHETRDSELQLHRHEHTSSRACNSCNRACNTRPVTRSFNYTDTNTHTVSQACVIQLLMT
jgi:hypothetical protein